MSRCIAAKKPSSILWLWSKNFCNEYDLLFHIKDYIFNLEFNLHKNPMSLVFKNNTIEIHITDTDNSLENPIIHVNKIPENNEIICFCSPSWGLPQAIRGKIIHFKHKKLVRDLLFSQE